MGRGSAICKVASADGGAIFRIMFPQCKDFEYSINLETSLWARDMGENLYSMQVIFRPT